MRLLLDEMISPRIARELRGRSFDVQAVKGDRPDLQAVSDHELLRRAALERRAVVTNDVFDFQPLHDRILAAGEEHFGLVFTFDGTMPRTKAAIPLWIEALASFLGDRPSDDALRKRVHHLS